MEGSMIMTATHGVAAALALALVGAACSDDGGSSGNATPGTSAVVEPEAVRVATLDGVDAPGPARYDRVTVDIPIYAIETSLGAGRVLRAARAVADQSNLADDQVTLVDASDTMAHVDPLAADPSRNEFLDTVVPFLQAIG
jgi:hypothetical protein